MNDLRVQTGNTPLNNYVNKHTPPLSAPGGLTRRFWGNASADGMPTLRSQRSVGRTIFAGRTIGIFCHNAGTLNRQAISPLSNDVNKHTSINIHRRLQGNGGGGHTKPTSAAPVLLLVRGRAVLCRLAAAATQQRLTGGAALAAHGALGGRRRVRVGDIPPARAR